MARKRKETDEDKAYEVKDKRRVNPDGSLKEDEVESPKSKVESPEPEQAGAPEQAEHPEPVEGAETGGEMPQLDLGHLALAWLSTLETHQLLQILIGTLSDKAWQHMGVRLAPGEKEPSKDMVRAKLAIDIIVFIADKISPQLDEENRRAIRGLITDLQLNFVQQGQ